ncbi:MAG: hypothetical protein LBG95_01135 [Treponema sp.]|jgi:hypothetical protein|nr:hypothetical protein [Treponema sp.]
MRKIVLGIACLIAIMSCGIEIPSSVTIKGKPEVHIPLGSPFTEANRLENSISSGKEDGGTVLYDYQDNKEVQTYLIQYPIVELTFDLTSYVNNAAVGEDEELLACNIPESIGGLGKAEFDNDYPNGIFLTGTNGPQNDEDINDPTFTIVLSDMAKTVTEINSGPFGIETGYNANYEQNLWVKIPAFEINDYRKGIHEDGKLRFVNNTQFKPKEKLNDGKLEIFVKVTGPCSGATVFDMVFEWVDAVIDTANDPIEGGHVISNGLREYLGDNVTYKNAEGYIFVNGIDKGASMSLDFDDKSLLDPPVTPLDQEAFPRPTGFEFTGQLSTHSLKTPIDMTEVLNNKSASKMLKHKIFIEEFRIFNNAGDNGKTITADMVVLLPLEFAVANAPSDPDYLPEKYVKLNLGNLFTEPGDSDLFFRTGENENLIDQHIRMKIFLTNVNNTIVDDSNLSLLVYSEDKSERIYEGIIKFSDENPNTQFVIDKSFPNPFSPRFHTILEKDDNEDYATFIIKRPRDSEKPIFDFHLNVEVKADLNYVIDL